MRVCVCVCVNIFGLPLVSLSSDIVTAVSGAVYVRLFLHAVVLLFSRFLSRCPITLPVRPKRGPSRSIRKFGKDDRRILMIK